MLSPLNMCAIRILLFDEEGYLSSASGCLYRTGADLRPRPQFLDQDYNHDFILTNWHVVSGRHFITKNYLGGISHRVPTYARVLVPTDYSSEVSVAAHADPSRLERITVLKTNLSREASVGVLGKRIELYNSDRSTPKWMEHPSLGSDIDVIAIPADDYFGTSEWLTYVNCYPLGGAAAGPGNAIFIIGFPSGLSAGNWRPVWKSGYVASEPSLDVTISTMTHPDFGELGGLRLPAFFIDSLTREGMSGSPVFFKQTDITTGSETPHFLGIYSGRASPREDQASLGLCWRREVVREICQFGRTGVHPHMGA